MARLFTIAERAYRMLEADCLAYPDVETGGVLPGVVGKDGFRVPFVISAGPGACRLASRFSPDSNWQQHFLDFLFSRFGLDYIGDWHRHPAHADRPSAIDLTTAWHIVTSPDWNKPEAVFPIATVRCGTVHLRAFAISRAKQEFEELEVQIVPDTDRRIARVLLGKDFRRRGGKRS